MDDTGPRLIRGGAGRDDLNRLPRRLVVELAIPPVTALALFYVWPVVTLLARALNGEALRATLGRTGTWQVAWFTLWQATASTAITVVIGMAPAYVIARYEFVGRRVLIGLLTAVFVLPTVVMGAAFLALLPDSIDRTVWAVIGAHVVFNLAVVVRTVGAFWEHLPTDMESAAASLGARPLQVFTRISLPLLRPSITAAASIVFVFTFTSFGVIRILGAAGTRTLEVEVWRRATQLGDISDAAVLSLLQLLVLAVVIAGAARVQRRSRLVLALRPGADRRQARSVGQRQWVTTVAVTTGAVVVAPLCALALRSFSTPDGWSTTAWTRLGDNEVRPGIRLGIDPLEALVRSVQNAAWATAFAVVFGALASLAITATRRAGRLLDAGLMLPLGTSAVTIGFGMLITFDRAPVDWRAGWWLVPVGHALVAVPFVVRTTVGVLLSVDPALRAAAATLGADPTRAWRHVVVPFLWRPLTVGAALAAAISLGEFGATSLLSRSGGETIPIAIDQLIGRTGSSLQTRGYVLATILAVVTIVIVIAVDHLRGVSNLVHTVDVEPPAATASASGQQTR